ncbi:MAG: hypothetical protein ACE10I_05910, partial [Candidatus Acidiferrales bacterium]
MVQFDDIDLLLSPAAPAAGWTSGASAPWQVPRGSARVLIFKKSHYNRAPFFLAAAKYAVLASRFTGIQEKQDDETSHEDSSPNRAH